MITAKKLLPGRKENNKVTEETAAIQAEESQLHRLVKLSILLLLTYVIIFM